MKNIIYKIEKREQEGSSKYCYDVLTMREEWVERFRSKRNAIAYIKERGVELTDLVREILRMNDPTDQDIKILREWLFENQKQFNSSLGMRIIHYLNRHDN